MTLTISDAVLAACAAQLTDYFAGKRRHFELPLAARGTPFQQSVWDALADIPYGELRSYRDIARTIGNPAAVRAVGAANGRNPLPIVVPCHRVIGSNGTLTGFAGGLEVKRFLLELEGAAGSIASMRRQSGDLSHAQALRSGIMSSFSRVIASFRRSFSFFNRCSRIWFW